jgi:hypothetical protein
VALQSAALRLGRVRQTGRETQIRVVPPGVYSSACTLRERERQEETDGESCEEQGVCRPSHVSVGVL